MMIIGLIVYYSVFDSAMCYLEAFSDSLRLILSKFFFIFTSPALHERINAFRTPIISLRHDDNSNLHILDQLKRFSHLQ